MARPAARRNRRLVVATASAMALIATISGCVAMATEDPGTSAGPSNGGGGGGSSGSGDKGRSPGAASSGAATPPARVSAEITHESEDPGKTVNLTIDDGPEPGWTVKVLDLLKKYDAKATFCIIGSRAQEYPDLVKKVAAAGHRLCDHSADHNTAMDKRPESYQERQVLDAWQSIEKAAGEGARVSYYRAPGGAFTPYSREVAASHGMRPLGWNVDTHDWQNPGVDRIVDAVKKGMKEGPTVLFHDGGGNRGQTVAALERLLPWFKEQGYKFSYPKI
ncbi:hydrolase [Streptosporangium nondiastaticum]|uniref:Hydrolase n=1 Tax=Streptosporangium nondiastaticum TaxID=35764 RepID=A0A9X7JLN8_9ACTN|nr:polysaccharide deacetylase family protein [Streptosporangium nondiastaticum]PSJ26044.1 hydrolase [Streptosporangium nondiastaticum]